MPLIPIESVEDPRLDIYRDLKSPRSKTRQPHFIAESLILTERLLASPLETVSVLAEERFAERLIQQTPVDVSIFLASKELIRKIAGFDFHRGALGCGRRPTPQTLDQLLENAPQRFTLAVCVGVQLPENIGGILRTAAAMNVFAVILGPNCGDPFSRRVGRTSMGTNFIMPVLESADLKADLANLQQAYGTQVAATVLANDATPLRDADCPERIALLFGHEGHGLPPEWQDRCDTRLSIPMPHGVDSLNVSVAAGIFLHHFTHR